jgi:Flp pilus assembly protein TadD
VLGSANGMSHNAAHRLDFRKIVDVIRGGIPWWAGLTVLALLFVLPDAIAGRLSTVWLRFPGLDKPTHFLAFVVVFLIAYGVLHSLRWPVSERGKWGGALAASLVISVADEVQQAVIGRGRTAEFGDLVADAAGALVGLTVVSAPRLGIGRAFAIGTLLLVPVAAVTARTYNDLKHFNRGMVYEREQKYQQARAEYVLALDSGFQSAELYNTIAWLDIEFLDADPVEVERYTAKALALEPNNSDILDTHGWVLVREGRTREGLAFLERAKALNPRIYCIDLHLGVAYLAMGERSRAIEYLRRQAERSPEDRFGRSAMNVLAEVERQAK